MVIAQGVKIKDLFEIKVFDVNMSSFAFMGLSAHSPQLCGNLQAFHFIH